MARCFEIDSQDPSPFHPFPSSLSPGAREEGEGCRGEGLFSWFPGARQRTRISDCSEVKRRRRVRQPTDTPRRFALRPPASRPCQSAVRAGLVERAGDWPRSSVRDYAEKRAAESQESETLRYPLERNTGLVDDFAGVIINRAIQGIANRDFCLPVI